MSPSEKRTVLKLVKQGKSLREIERLTELSKTSIWRVTQEPKQVKRN